ncbi:hypothetical protein L3X38_002987 [Prunus dulcis]|uniref:Uncharacterized protein n=1 Tax=Prunus dulcis TaxID=3755 RepID=A0AAD4WVV4_PRUDU|nr:hypothetical protein L3X38_002987 [Prunus dulcis]
MSHPGINSAVARYCPLWAPLAALTVLFLGTHKQLPSGSPILGLLWPPTRLTSELAEPSKDYVVRMNPNDRDAKIITFRPFYFSLAFDFQYRGSLRRCSIPWGVLLVSVLRTSIGWSSALILRCLKFDFDFDFEFNFDVDLGFEYVFDFDSKSTDIMSHDDNRLGKRGKTIDLFFKKNGNDNKDTPSAIPKELTQLGSQVVEQFV